MATQSRSFGHIDGVPTGTTFATRKEASDALVHRPHQAGISGSPTDGADSIVVSGGYEDDVDSGAVIIYTGQGGNDPNTKKQIDHQGFDRGNGALAKSCDEGLPVRVVRGSAGNRLYSPATGYRYDGLFRVDQYWHEVGRSGFRVYRFRLVKLEDDTVTVSTSPMPAGTLTPSVRSGWTQRVVRSSAVSVTVKNLHDHTCQFCATRLVLATGPYAEGAHIRPLGRPHSGPDTPDNVLCLCPNCHVRFDAGVLTITSAFEVIDRLSGVSVGPLRLVGSHRPAEDHLRYHRDTIGRS